MIVWSGDGTDTSGQYHPATDTWTAMGITGAPSGRSAHTAVWIGSRMIVWGGNDGAFAATGGVWTPFWLYVKN